MTAEKPTLIISVDLEDWFQVENLRQARPLDTWDSCELRVEKNVRDLLDLFDRHGVSVTFFVLGWVAERLPGLVAEVSARGHEIASHGYHHEMCSELSEARLHEEISRSKELLESISGRPVNGFRAPCFSVTEPVVEILKEEGYLYDSSYNSFALNKRYGRAADLLHRSPDNRWVAHNGLWELPVSNLVVSGFTLPWGGGGYFRLLPTFLFESGVARILRSEGVYLFYCHPWEVDPGQPRVDALSALSRFRHYLNLSKTLGRIEHLLVSFRECRFATCGEYLGAAGKEERRVENVVSTPMESVASTSL
jgi:polysaccharide deacetylase family protein (PEP-CTERM system associated)